MIPFLSAVIPLSFKTCSDYLVIYEIDSSVLIYGYREKRKVARLHYGPDMFVVHTRRNADFLVIQKRFYHNFDIVDLKTGQVLESLRINELCFVTLGKCCGGSILN